MKQLGILDSAFINLEHPNTPQHVGSISIYDPSTAPGGFVRFKDVLDNFSQRLKTLPIFRTRLVEVPGGIDRPYWKIDDDFDVEFHIRHIALPQPGDWRQLCIQAARLHARQIDMSKPLWEAYIIEGLDNIPDVPRGSFAIYTKMHHSLVDGAGGQDYMSVLHDLEPDPEPSEGPAPGEKLYREESHSDPRLLRKALVNRMKNVLPLTRGAFNITRDLVDMGLKIRREELPAYPMDTPKTRFDQPVGPHRAFDALQFSLDDFKAIKNTTGTTINDVAVAVISGAARVYLSHHGELPEEPLAANMPVNMRTRKGVNDDNNQVGAITGIIHTNIIDPLERLASINSSLKEAKKFIDTPMVDPLKLAGVFSPMVSKALARFYINNEVTRQLPMGGVGVITNVPGPPFDMYCAGAKLVRFYNLGLLTPGGALFHTVFSMSDMISISVLADRDIMPDIQFYIECLQESFETLREAALGSSVKSSKTGSSGKSSKNLGKKAPKKNPRKARARRKAAPKIAVAKKVPARKQTH